MTAGAPVRPVTKPQRSKSRQPPTCVESTTRCFAKFTGPPKPMPQRSKVRSRCQAVAISRICASIQSRPPWASVARDSRRTMRSPSNAAMVNLVPPISIARIIYRLLEHAGGLEVASLHDGDGRGIDVLAERSADVFGSERLDLALHLVV